MDRQQTERTTCKKFRCGFVDNLIAKFPKPPKKNKKRQMTVRFHEGGNRALQKESEIGDNENNQEIYASMAQMSGNDKSFSRNFGDSL